jgi:TetR/AcrR family transcriptional regulator
MPDYEDLNSPVIPLDVPLDGFPEGVRVANRRAVLEKIMHAAAETFAEQGFDGASIAEIARRADLPKANVHYYFENKEILYRQVIFHILNVWTEQFSIFRSEGDPREILTNYIRAKIELSRKYPVESRVFAGELLRGAPSVEMFFRGRLRPRIDEVVRVFDAWAAQGLIDPIDPKHFLFMVWSATQAYADSRVQICAVLGIVELSEADYNTAAHQITAIILKGCGVRSRPNHRRRATDSNST